MALTHDSCKGNNQIKKRLNEQFVREIPLMISGKWLAERQMAFYNSKDFFNCSYYFLFIWYFVSVFCLVFFVFFGLGYILGLLVFVLFV